MSDPNFQDRGGRSDPKGEAPEIRGDAGTYDLNALHPSATKIAVVIPASGNMVIKPHSVGKRLSGDVLIYVSEDNGTGNVQDSTSGVDGGLSGFPSLSNLTAVGDYWWLRYAFGSVVELVAENAT